MANTRHLIALGKWRRRYRENLVYIKKVLASYAKEFDLPSNRVVVNDFMLNSPEYMSFTLDELRSAVQRQERLKRLGGRPGTKQLRREQHIGREIIILGNEFQPLNSRDYRRLYNLRLEEQRLGQAAADLARELNPELFPERLQIELQRTDVAYNDKALRKFARGAQRTVEGRGSRSPVGMAKNYKKVVAEWQTDIAREAVLSKMNELGNQAAGSLLYAFTSDAYHSDQSLYVLFWDSEGQVGSSEMLAYMTAFQLFGIDTSILDIFGPGGEIIEEYD